MPTLADMYDGFLVDLEGMVDRNTGAIPFASDTVDRLYPVAFVSTTRTAAAAMSLLATLNIDASRARVVTLGGLVSAPRPLLREAIHRTGAWYPLAISQSLAFAAAARQIHVPSVLVLNESTNLRSLLQIPRDERPTFVATDLRDLFRHQPIVDGDARYWECEGWIAMVTHDGRLRLRPGPPSTLGAGARVMCAAAWNFPGTDLDIDSAVELFTSLAA